MDNKKELFENLIKECEKVVVDCGYTLPDINYSLNTRTQRALGRCKIRIDRVTKEKSNIRIELTESYFLAYARTKQYDKIKNTILHEMCHALPNGHNHGYEWQKYARVIGKASGQNISRLVENDEVISELKIKRTKYIIECSDCGMKYTYARRPKFANRLESCNCSKCKSKRLIFKEI